MGKLLRKILSVPNAAFQFIAENFLVRWLRDGRAGKHGRFVEYVLTSMAGYKTICGFAFGMIAYMLASFGLDHEAGWVMLFAGAMFTAGITDKAVQAPGRPLFLENSWLYRFLAQNAGMLASSLTTALAYVMSSACTPVAVYKITITCHAMELTLAGVAIVLVYIGILDQGFMSKTSRHVRMERLATELQRH